VFIPRRVNQRGQRFSFVRFYDVKNVRRMKKELDSIRIGTMKLHVNLPRYLKRDVKNNRSVGTQNTEKNRERTI